MTSTGTRAVRASRDTEEEVRGWYAEAGLEVLHLDIGDGGISVRAHPCARRRGERR